MFLILFTYFCLVPGSFVFAENGLPPPVFTPHSGPDAAGNYIFNIGNNTAVLGASDIESGFVPHAAILGLYNSSALRILQVHGNENRSSVIAALASAPAPGARPFDLWVSCLGPVRGVGHNAMSYAPETGRVSIGLRSAFCWEDC